jgi:hypothetical protein
MQGHPFEVFHKPGITNPADSLSRLYENEAGTLNHKPSNNEAGTQHHAGVMVMEADTHQERIVASLFAVTMTEFHFDPDLLKMIKEASKT